MTTNIITHLYLNISKNMEKYSIAGENPNHIIEMLKKICILLP